MSDGERWVKLHVRYYEDPAMQLLSSAPKELFLAGVCYCMEQLTDGELSTNEVLTVAARLRLAPSTRRGAVNRLVEVGLWDEVYDGYMIPNYLKWNPSRRQILARRKGSKERMAKSRANRPSVMDEVFDHDDEDFEDESYGVTDADVAGDRGRERVRVTSSSRSKTFTPVLDEVGGGDTSTGQPPHREDAAIDLLARRDMATQRARGFEVNNPAAYLGSCRRARDEADGARVRSLAAENPDWSPEQLAEATDPPIPPAPKPAEYIAEGTFTGVKPDFAELRRIAGLKKAKSDTAISDGDPE